jgi:septal ring factor EnvC (AmiA/AmiB activator)
MVVLLLFLSNVMYAQSTDDDGNLESRQKRLEARVQKTKKLLEETRRTKKRSFSELALLKKQIMLREQLVSGLSYQIVKVEDEILRMSGLIASIEKDVQLFQKNYANLAYVAYKSQDNILSVWLWIFASNSLKQSYDRLIYFKEFSKYRKEQLVAILKLKKHLSKRKEYLESRRNEKTLLINKQFKEKEELASSKIEKDKLYEQLKSSEQEYKQQLKSYKKDLAQIRRQIREMVLEARKNKQESHEVTVSTNKLSSSFEKNRGKLPWPVSMSSAFVTGYFGKTTTETGGEIINDGIYITVPKNEKVRAVYGGLVTMVGKIPSVGNVVIIQHGDYRTVYANLESVYISKGDTVETLKEIGRVKTHAKTGDTQLYFQIYREFNPVNPMSWISEK